jgi:hypothetical protein
MLHVSLLIVNGEACLPTNFEETDRGLSVKSVRLMSGFLPSLTAEFATAEMRRICNQKSLEFFWQPKCHRFKILKAQNSIIE